MILWVNGPFGVGKTTVANLLVEHMHGALRIDPEKIGHALWAQLPPELRREEFELEPVWRALTRRMVADMAGLYARPLVVAMTIARRAVFEQIIDGLRSDGYCVKHFTLMASAATIRSRIQTRMQQRGERPDSWGELSWEGLQVNRCLAELDHPNFAVHVDTEGRDASRVADAVLAALGT